MKIKNNPLNIKYKSCNNWQGQLKPLDGYCRFKAVEYGFRVGVVVYFRLKALDKLSFKSFIYALYGDDDKEKNREYVINILEMCNFSDKESFFKQLPPRFNELSDIPIFYLPAILQRLACLEQGFNDTRWDGILVNVVSTYMFKCGISDDVTSLNFY